MIQDGEVTKKEFIQGLDQLHIKLSHKELEAVFNEVDKSNDGALSY